jgi:hypothetical protein
MKKHIDWNKELKSLGTDTATARQLGISRKMVRIARQQMELEVSPPPSPKRTTQQTKKRKRKRE